MSALVQKQTLEKVRVMSALPPKADMVQHDCDVRFVPKADSCTSRLTAAHALFAAGCCPTPADSKTHPHASPPLPKRELREAHSRNMLVLLWNVARVDRLAAIPLKADMSVRSVPKETSTDRMRICPRQLLR